MTQTNSHSLSLKKPDLAKAMTSREIATFTGKQHKNVIRDIERVLDQLKLPRLNFGHSYLDAQNQRRKQYHLDKHLTLTLVAGYSTKLRAAIIDRWQELEAAPSNPPLTFVEALRARVDELEAAKLLVSTLEADDSKKEARR